MPTDTFSHTTTVTATPEVVKAALELAQTWEGLGPIEDVWDANVADDRLVGFRWRARAAGKTWEGTAQRQGDPANDPMRLELSSSELTGIITIDLEPVDDGAFLTVTMTARSKSLLAGMFWGVIADAMCSGLPGQVDSFAEQF